MISVDKSFSVYIQIMNILSSILRYILDKLNPFIHMYNPVNEYYIKYTGNNVHK